MMAIRVPSKFELMRLCKSTNTTARSIAGPPSPDELGFAKSLSVKEIGGTNCIVLEQVRIKERGHPLRCYLRPYELVCLDGKSCEEDSSPAQWVTQPIQFFL